MRLLRTDPQPSLTEYPENRIPDYAILSHRWGDQEISFQDMLKNQRNDSEGYEKAKRFCDRAAEDGYDHAWIDTCCINKESSAELSEAINSMFHWYQAAGVCYAYLNDVVYDEHQDQEHFHTALKQSQWFTRGWTLQELLAPTHLVFLDRNWVKFGTKETLCSVIQDITGIDHTILSGTSPIQSASISKRMSWASDRVTTRTEDIAYCLMGLFNVNMPLLYGEGERAFIRLQEEIMKDSDDQTLFAWEDGILKDATDHEPLSGLLAQSPAKFRNTGDLIPFDFLKKRTPYAVTNIGVSLTLPLIWALHGPECIGVLQCKNVSGLYNGSLVGIMLRRVGANGERFVRYSPCLFTNLAVFDLHYATLELTYVTKTNAQLRNDTGILVAPTVSYTTEFMSTVRPLRYIIRHSKVRQIQNNRNLIICFDGHVKPGRVSNVRKIAELVSGPGTSQLCYYHHHQTDSRTEGVEEQVRAGLKWLSESYKPGDQIFLFGFSTGAYAAQILSLQLRYFKLDAKVEFSLLSRMTMVKKEVSPFDTANLFDGLRFFRAKRHVPVVAFLGLFDAIDCASPQYKMAKGASEFIFMRPGPARVVRHAVSFHDRQLVLDPCLLQEEIEYYKDLQDIREIWFPGRHIDIGGVAKVDVTDGWSLSDAPLAWVMHGAIEAGLEVNHHHLRKLLKCENEQPADPSWINLHNLGCVFESQQFGRQLEQVVHDPCTRLQRKLLIPRTRQQLGRWILGKYGQYISPQTILLHATARDKPNVPKHFSGLHRSMFGVCRELGVNDAERINAVYFLGRRRWFQI